MEQSKLSNQFENKLRESKKDKELEYYRAKEELTASSESDPLVKVLYEDFLEL